MFEVIAVSAAVALVSAGAVCFGVIRYYKRGLFSPIYPLEHYTRLDLRHSDDVFIDRTVTRVRVSSSKDDKD
ncbi:MAG: hypothetical protein IKC61_06250 [Clostridia bacterium]|nr:hypothetical protein [Clostridia bacterium]